jgi:hypothetical protein
MGLDQDYSTDVRLEKSDAKSEQKTDKPVSNAELALAIRELNKSINQMIKIFEDANQELIDEYQGSKGQLKEKLDEISDQNEKIAQGLVGLADIVHKDDSTPEKPANAKTPENNAGGIRWDTDIPELEKPPVQGQQIQPKHDFDLGFKDEELQEVSFNNKTGVKPATDWKAPAPQSAPQQPQAQGWPPQPQKTAQDWPVPLAPKQDIPQQKTPNWNQPNNWQQQQPWDNAQEFSMNDPFANQDPFANKPNFSGPDEFSLPNPEDNFMPPSMPGNAAPQQFPQGNAPQPNAWDFNQQQNTFAGPDFPPAVPEPPKKKGLFASLMKK